MNTVDHSSRRQFLKKSGIILAASGFAALDPSFAKEQDKEKKVEEVSPPEDLMREHGV